MGIVIGIIIASRFAGMETLDRQNLIGDIIATNFTPEEGRQVMVIVAVTPEEGTGYLAGDEGVVKRN
jgi:hypothetical protein